MAVPPPKDPQHPSPDDQEDVDGVVLFDPTPREPRQDPTPVEPGPEPEPERRGMSGIVLGVMIGGIAAAVALGGYELYTGANAGPEETPPPTEPVVDTAPANLPPPQIAAVDGDTIEAPVGSTVTVEVRATRGVRRPLPDELVRFELLSGSANLLDDTVRTDRNGVASAALAVSPRAGPVVVSASMAELRVSTRITVDVQAGAPRELIALAGDGQEADMGELLPERPQVRVLDIAGNPVQGVEVRFAMESGGGMVGGSTARTDSAGLASTLWRLGMQEGVQELSATVPALGSSVTFTARALPPPVVVEGAPRAVEVGPVDVVRHPYVVGGSHVCRLRAATAECRGGNDRGQRGTGAMAGLVSLASGVSHVCGLTDDGEALCWGANGGGQLGDGTREDHPSPVPVQSDRLRFASLTAGLAHTCGLARGGVAVCWGQNLNGQLGDDSRTDARFPRAVGGGLTFESLEAGWNHTCGISTSGNAFCWGLNSDGQLGAGDRVDHLLPVVVRGSVETLSAGSAHTCGIGDAGVLCWGDGSYGQLGNGSLEGSSQPVAVQNLPGSVIAITSGAVHSCVLVSGGAAYCWGQNRNGQLGDGTTENRSTATAVAGDLRFRSIEAGGALTCGITSDGAEYCWGLNQLGQIGDGTRETRTTPTRVPD